MATYLSWSEVEVHFSYSNVDNGFGGVQEWSSKDNGWIMSWNRPNYKSTSPKPIAERSNS
jgi:hypothetical protein